LPVIDSRKIGKDLAGIVKGHVWWDDLTRGMYSTAACIFEVEPLAVVAPEDAGDVCAVLEYAAGYRIPVIPRGGGSSLAGQAVGRAIILDCAQFMNGVLDIDADRLTARVQPGVLLGRLNRQLSREGLFFAPDPSSANYCTLGGMIANNAGGAHSVKYGSTTDHVLSLEAVLPGGRVLDTASGDGAGGDLPEQYMEMEKLLRGNESIIRDNRPRTTKNSSGYNLAGALGIGARRSNDPRGAGLERAGGGQGDRADGPSNGGIDLTRLLVGSEGTLGTVVEATLKLTRAPATRGSALIGLSSLEAAGEAIVGMLELGPSALELMGQTFLELVDRKELEGPGAFMSETDTALLIEFEGSSSDEVGEKLDRVQKMLDGNRAVIGMRAVRDPVNAQQVWGLRAAAVAILNRMEGPEKPIAFIEDVTVLPEKLPDFIRGELEIFGRHGVRAGVFGHGGDGNLHVRPVLNPKNPDHVRKMRSIAEDVYELAAGMGGSPTGEHGDGRLRTGFIGKFYGDAAPLFEKVKRIFDPTGIMNPGNIVGRDEEYALDVNLRYGASYRTVPTNEVFDEPALANEIEKCHGCGACRDYCPVGSTTLQEDGSARTKANLLRRIITGKLGDPQETLRRDDLKSVFDLCFNCKLCLTECPTRVDVPRLAAEARACYVKAKGLDKASSFVANSFEVSRLAALRPGVANFAMHRPLSRRLLQKTVGIDRRRKLPDFCRKPMNVPVKDAEGPRKVLYYPGCYALFNDADGEGRAALDVLRAVGASVWVPNMECCGIARVTLGDKEGAAKRARANIEVLHKAVGGGYSIVASAASCCLAIKEDYPLLLGTAQSREVAANTYDLFEYLAALFAKGEAVAAPGPLRMRVVHHVPCHLLAQGVAGRVEQVLRMIPGIEIIGIQDSCCGMAGTFGMKSRNFDLSMEIGKALFDEVRRVSPDVVVTGCGTCKIQLEQGTGLEVHHPIWLLKKAFENKEPRAGGREGGVLSGAGRDS
jgi:FAD/FMN-containing dehydrogenase/Fe-S oxidoreductase